MVLFVLSISLDIFMKDRPIIKVLMVGVDLLWDNKVISDFGKMIINMEIRENISIMKWKMKDSMRKTSGL